MGRLKSGVTRTWSGWRITHPEGSFPVETAPPGDFETLFARLEHPDIIIKDDHRSQVGTFEMDGFRLAVKKFLLQRNWFWFRLTSLLFPTLGEIAFRNALELDACGFLTPVPLLLAQRRRQGMVRDSWLLYPYFDGVPLTREDDGEIVDLVRRMHRAGWIHCDPHPENFIRTPRGVALVDPIRARRSRCRYLQAYDVVLTANAMPSALDGYGRKELGWWYNMARAGHQTVRFYRRVKHTLRRWLGIRGSGR